MHQAARRLTTALGAAILAAAVMVGTATSPAAGDPLGPTPTTVTSLPLSDDNQNNPDEPRQILDDLGAPGPVVGAIDTVVDAADTGGEDPGEPGQDPGEPDPEEPGPDPDPEEPGPDPEPDPDPVVDPDRDVPVADVEPDDVDTPEKDRPRAGRRHGDRTRRPGTPVASIPEVMGEIVMPVFATMARPLQWDFLDYAGLLPGPRSTREVLDLADQAGLSRRRLCEVLTPFPVCGPAHYSNDFGAPRFVPTPHPHQGTDIFAPRGTPVVATTDGEITSINRLTAVGGNSVYLTAANGTYYYYAHLDLIAPQLRVGLEVTAGTPLGTVGATGNARGTPPHLHFEIHPHGGEAVPPVTYLDSWLAQAADELRAMLARDGAQVVVPGQAPAFQAGGVAPAPALLAGPAASTRQEESSYAPGLLALTALGGLWLARRSVRRVLAFLRERLGALTGLERSRPLIDDALASYLDRLAEMERPAPTKAKAPARAKAPAKAAKDEREEVTAGV